MLKLANHGADGAAEHSKRRHFASEEVVRHQTDINRRHLIAGLGVTGLIAAAPANAAFDAAASLDLLEKRSGGRLGVHAINLQTGRTLSHRSDERFKLMSSFKGLLAAMLLAEVAAGRERLDAVVRFGRGDIMAASPITTAHVDAGVMTVDALAAAMMAHSDNAAANLLVRRLGGPAAVTSFLRQIGDQVTRIDNYEGPQLALTPIPANSSTPRAIIATLRTILVGSALPPAGKQQWERWMASNIVGLTRLRAALPANWPAGDRTGTADGICNDYAFARPPGRAPLLIACYYTAPGSSLEAQEATVRAVGRIVIDRLGQNMTSGEFGR